MTAKEKVTKPIRVSEEAYAFLNEKKHLYRVESIDAAILEIKSREIKARSKKEAV
jgi:hypothetical protein